MKNRNRIKKTVLSIAAISLFITACERTPTAAFRYVPTENIEIGDTIFFINESLDATSYEWDFGNGVTSNVAEPAIIYEYADYYKVYLNAINKSGNDTISQILDINQATSLGFQVLQPDTVPLQGCNVWVYDNEADLVNEADPLFFSQTDADGVAFFEKMEAIVYYVSFFKETSEGLYWRKGYTYPLTPYNINLYQIYLNFTPAEDLKSSESGENQESLHNLLPKTEVFLQKR